MQLADARDEQAWIEARIGAGIDSPQLAVVAYSAPAVIYGRRGHRDGEIPARALRADCDVVQRRSGGGAVLAGPWLLGLDLLLPPTHALSKMGHVAAFLSLGQALREVLLARGVPCSIADEVQIASHNAAAHQADLEWVCFAGLSHGELIDAHGGKLLGLAQSRGRWGALISAGLLLAQTPWEMLEAIHRGRPCQRSTMHTQASVGLAALAPQMSCEQICHAVLDALVPYLQSNPDLQTNYERKCA